MTRFFSAPARPDAPGAQRPRRSIRRVRLSLAAMAAAMLAACSASVDPAAALAEARNALEQRDARAAEIRLKDLLQNGQDSAEARELLARAYLLSNDLNGAEKEFRRALELGAQPDRVMPSLIGVLVRQGAFDRAISDAQAVQVSDAAAKAEVLTAVGRAHMGRRQPDDARRAFEQALAARPDWVGARAGLLTLQAGSNPDGALAATLKALEGAPDAPELLLLAGDISLAKGRMEVARDHYARAAKAAPGNSEARVRLAAVLIDLGELDGAAAEVAQLRKLAPNAVGTLQMIGLLEFRRGNLAGARDAVQQAQRLAPDFVPVLALGANVALASNAPDQAERNARRVIEAAPAAPQGYRLLASAYLQMNEPEKALAAVQPFLARTGVVDGTILALAGEAALKSGDFATAARHYQKAAELDPGNAGKRTNLALARLSAGDRERGYAELEAATKLSSAGGQADYALIAARLRDRDYDRAMAAVDALAAKRPDDPGVLTARGAVLGAKGDLAGARAAFEEAARKRPTDLTAAGNLAALDLREGNKEAARKRYETVLAADPKNVPARMALVQMAARDGQKDELRKQIELARGASPEALQPLLAMAGWHLDHGAPRDAVTLLQEAAIQHPDRVEVLEALALAQSRAGDTSQALATLDRLSSSRPDSAPLHLRIGELKLQFKDEAGGLAALRRASALAPEAPEPRLALAAALLRSGKKAEAQQVAVQAQRELPRSPAGFLLAGDVAAADQKWDDAASAYRRANGVAPTPAGALKMHQALSRAGHEAEAEAAIRGHLKEHATDSASRLYYAQHLLGRKRWKDAAEQYQAVIARDPNNAVALNNLAWSLHQLKDPKAVDYAERAWAAAPRSATVADTLGMILVDQGKTARGIELLRQAVTTAPREPQFRLHLAESLARQGDKGAAREQLGSLLKEAPTGPVADAARELERRL